MSKAHRIGMTSAAVFAIAYIGALMAGESSLTTPVKVVLSFVALAGFIMFVVAELHVIRGLDELERRIQLEALAFAFPVSVGMLMLLGLLQRFMMLPMDDLSYRHLWPAMMLAYFIGLALARWRYQ